MRRPLLSVLVCLACSTATKQMPAPAKLAVSEAERPDVSRSARLDGLAKRYWKTLLDTTPVARVFDGGGGGPRFAPPLGDHRFDGRLDDWSPAARRKRRD